MGFIGSAFGSSASVSFMTFGTRISDTVAERMRIHEDGNVGINKTDPSAVLEVVGDVEFSGLGSVTDDRTVCAISTSGELELKDGACGTSSARFKENITSLDYGLAELTQLNPVSFTYINDTSTTRTERRLGLIAEQVQPIIPEVVTLDETGQIEGIDYANLIPLLIKSIQEQQAQITSLTELIGTREAFNVHGDTTLFGNLFVKGELSISNQQAGFATIPAGGTSVEVIFTKPFTKTPLIQLTPQTVSPGYWVSATAPDRFMITITEAAAQDITFGWTTLSVEEPTVTVGLPAAQAGLPEESAPAEVAGEEVINTPIPSPAEPRSDPADAGSTTGEPAIAPSSAPAVETASEPAAISLGEPISPEF
jgi:hypothetical protein